MPDGPDQKAASVEQKNIPSRVLEEKRVREAIIRFCGDSGDGMQLTGTQFTTTTGVAGNDLMTFPDYPAEIRAPQGTLSGVSGFQVHFAAADIYTPGDQVDVLVAMNPAALKTNLKDLKAGGILILNTDAFDEKNLARVHYDKNPLDDSGLKEKYNVIPVQITKLTRLTVEGLDLPQNVVDRSKNFFALGIAYWLFHRDPATTLRWLEDKFSGKEKLMQANQRALKAGFNFAETCELFAERYEIDSAKFKSGTYRNITGNSAMAIGLVTASKLADLPMMLGSYPITPASDILHELARYKNYGVKTFQAEDEIAAIGSALGASYGGSIGVTTSSGPGIALKSEMMNLAVSVELPLVIVNVQRGGPSTGLPTKTEQADLLQVMFGRNGESPIPIISASNPADCFDVAVEAVRIALKFMTPVVVLSDGYIANGSEPWLLPKIEELPKIENNIVKDSDLPDFQVFRRKPDTLGRLWPIPGKPGFEHRIGGLEKDALTGHISYDPENHEIMTHTRAKKIANIANFVPEQSVFGDEKGELLILSWGSTFGSVRSAVEQLHAEGKKVSHAHLRYLNPFPRNLEKLLTNFKKVLIPEINLGQLALLIQGRFLKPVISLNKVQGKPFLISEIRSKILECLN